MTDHPARIRKPDRRGFGLAIAEVMRMAEEAEKNSRAAVLPSVKQSQHVKAETLAETANRLRVLL